MKTGFKRLTSIALALIMVMVMTTITVFADERSSEGFKPDENSTWGDVYRYFKPAEFEAFPEFVQDQLNNTLLEDQSNDTSASVSTRAADQASVTVNNMEDIVFTTGNIYSKEQDNVTGRSIDIKGLTSLHLGASSTKTEIEVSAVLACTIQCPYLYCSVLIKDPNGTVLGITSESEYNAAICSVDDYTFGGLKSNTTYTLSAVGVITPPDGYFSSGNLVTGMNKATK